MKDLKLIPVAACLLLTCVLGGSLWFVWTASIFGAFIKLLITLCILALLVFAVAIAFQEKLPWLWNLDK